MAAAAAVELLVGLLHHPLRHHAPADPQGPPMQQRPSAAGGSPLGALPHQLRFFLGTFGLVQPIAHAFEHCTACNRKVVGEYRVKGFGFVREACREASVLGQVSGLETFQAECDALVSTADFDLDDSDDDM
jgi:ubiquitin-like modifier-activating enzyme ATG7